MSQDNFFTPDINKVRKRIVLNCNVPGMSRYYTIRCIYIDFNLSGTQDRQVVHREETCV